MKTTKFAAALLALIMVLSLGVTAWAAPATGTDAPLLGSVIDGGEEGKILAEFALTSYTMRSPVTPGGKVEITMNFAFRCEDEENFNNFRFRYLVLEDTNFSMIDSTGKAITRIEIDDSAPALSDGDKVENVKVTVKVSPNATTGTYPLNFKAIMEYTQVEGNITMRSVVSLYPATMNVREHDGDAEPEEPSSSEVTVKPILTPHLVITGFSTAGAELADDENFGFSVTFKNTSRDVPVQNVLITVSLPDGVSMPFASTNFYIDRIAANSSETLSFTLKGKKNIEEDVLPLGLAFNYQYFFNEAYLDGSDSETIGLSFGGGEQEEAEDRFEVSGVTLPDYLYPGEEGYLTIKMVNKGKEQIMNVQAKIESPNLQNTGASEYFGLLDVNKQDEIELPMMALEGGEVIGTVTISYELTDGTEKTVVRDFTAYAEEISQPVYDPGWEDPGMYEPEQPAGPAWWVWALIVVGGVVVLIVVIVVLKKRAAKKKQAAIDAEDSEDNE